MAADDSHRSLGYGEVVDAFLRAARSVQEVEHGVREAGTLLGELSTRGDGRACLEASRVTAVPALLGLGSGPWVDCEANEARGSSCLSTAVQMPSRSAAVVYAVLFATVCVLHMCLLFCRVSLLGVVVQ